MTGKEKGAEDGAALWRRARASWRKSAGAPAEPDALTLAAYLDGALDEQAGAAVETWMAASAEGLDSVLAARAALAETAGRSPGAAPRHMIARAKGVVRSRAGRVGRGGRGGAFFGDFGALLRPAAWAGVAAAVLLASASGFELGRAGVEHLASLDAVVSQDVRLVMGRAGPDLL